MPACVCSSGTTPCLAWWALNSTARLWVSSGLEPLAQLYVPSSRCVHCCHHLRITLFITNVCQYKSGPSEAHPLSQLYLLSSQCAHHHCCYYYCKTQMSWNQMIARCAHTLVEKHLALVVVMFCRYSCDIWQVAWCLKQNMFCTQATSWISKSLVMQYQP